MKEDKVLIGSSEQEKIVQTSASLFVFVSAARNSFTPTDGDVEDM